MRDQYKILAEAYSKVQQVQEDHDHEGATKMAVAQVSEILRNAHVILGILEDLSTGGIEPWMANKISVANEGLEAVKTASASPEANVSDEITTKFPD